MRWLEYNFQAREQFITEILKCIRFGVFVPWLLIEFKKYPKELEHIFGKKDVLELIDEAISFITIKQYRKGNPKEINYKFLNPDEQIERQLINDPLSKGKPLQSINLSENYQKFKLYLQQIKTCGNDHWQSITLLK